MLCAFELQRFSFMGIFEGVVYCEIRGIRISGLY